MDEQDKHNDFMNQDVGVDARADVNTRPETENPTRDRLSTEERTAVVMTSVGAGVMLSRIVKKAANRAALREQGAVAEEVLSTRSPNAAYSPEFMERYLDSNFVDVAAPDMHPFASRPVTHAGEAIQAMDNYISHLPRFAQVMMVESEALHYLHPNIASLNEGRVLEIEGDAAGIYNPDETRIDFTPESHPRSTHGHETGHLVDNQASKRLGGLGGYYSEAMPGWSGAVNDYLTKPRPLGQEFVDFILPPARLHTAGYRSLASHLQGYPTTSFEREALAEVFSSHANVMLEHPNNPVRVDELMNRAYPHIWPVYRDQYVPQMEEVADRMLAFRAGKEDQLVRLARGLHTQMGLPFDAAQETALRARTGLMLTEDINIATGDFKQLSWRVTELDLQLTGTADDAADWYKRFDEAYVASRRTFSMPAIDAAIQQRVIEAGHGHAITALEEAPRFQTQMRWRDGVDPISLDFVEQAANGEIRTITRQATPFEAYSRGYTAFVDSSTIDTWSGKPAMELSPPDPRRAALDLDIPEAVHRPSLGGEASRISAGLNAAEDAFRGTAGLRSGGRAVTSIIPTPIDNLVWTGAFVVGIGLVGGAAQTNEEVREGWKELTRGDWRALSDRMSTSNLRVNAAIFDGGSHAADEMSGHADYARGDNLRAGANIAESVIGVPFATGVVDFVRERRAMAAVPAEEVARVRALTIPVHFAPTGNAAFDRYVKRHAEILDEARNGMDFGTMNARVGRPMVTPQQIEFELEQNARQYLATGGSELDAMRRLPEGQATLQRLETGMRAVPQADVDALLALPLKTPDQVTDPLLKTYLEDRARIDGSIRMAEQRAHYNQMFYGENSLLAASNPLAAFETTPEAAEQYRQDAARRYLRDGGTVSAAMVQLNRAPFGVTPETLKELEEVAELMRGDGMIAGRPADRKLDAEELGAALTALRVDMQTVDTDHDYIGSTQEILAAVARATGQGSGGQSK